MNVKSEPLFYRVAVAGNILNYYKARKLALADAAATARTLQERAWVERYCTCGCGQWLPCTEARS